MKLKHILCILFVLTLLSACGLQAKTPMPSIEKPNDPKDTEGVVKPEDTSSEPQPESVKPTEDPYPVDEGNGVIEDLSAQPVVVSAIVPAEDGEMQLVTQGLNRNANYAKLPVVNNAILKADPRIDEAGNVYLLYGAKETYFTKLHPEGGVETKEVDVSAVVDTLWVGEALLICQRNATEDLFVVTTTFETEVVENVKCGDKMGLSNGKMDRAVWFNTSEADGKILISYHTYNPISKETHEGNLELPFARAEVQVGEVDTDTRYMADVIAVDSETDNIILTYMAYTQDSSQSEYWLEVYDPERQEVVAKEPGGSINHGIGFSGPAIFSSGTPGTEVITVARRLSDLSFILKYDDYAPKKFNGNLQWDWLVTNGSLWYRMNNEVVLIYDNHGTKLLEVENTLTFPEDVLPGRGLRIALPFDGGK